MHILSGLCGDDAGWALSELQGRVRDASNPARREAGEISRVHRAYAQIKRLCWTFDAAWSSIKQNPPAWMQAARSPLQFRKLHALLVI
jgi:hypothetical protein